MKKSVFISHFQIIFLMVTTLICHQTIYAQNKADINLIKFSVNNDGRELFGLKDPDGNIVLPANYSSIVWADDNNYALVGHPTSIEGTGIIDREGKLILDPVKYKNCDIERYENDNGLLVVFINGFAKTVICLDQEPYKLYGFINTRGEEVVRPQYVKVGKFINGTVEVETQDGNVFRIDATGKKM